MVFVVSIFIVLSLSLSLSPRSTSFSYASHYSSVDIFLLTGLNCFAFNSCHSTSTPKDVPHTHTHTHIAIRTNFWFFFCHYWWVPLLLSIASHIISWMVGLVRLTPECIHVSLFSMAFSIKMTTTMTTTTIQITLKKKIGTTIVQQMRHEYKTIDNTMCVVVLYCAVLR